MAIAFSSSSVSDETAAASAILAQTAMREALIDHPSGAWTLVEEFESVGGEMHWIVVKNSTDESGTGQDFHVVIGRRVADGAICWMLSEGYTDANNTLDSFAPWPWANASFFKVGADFRYYVAGAVATYALGASFPTAQAAIPLTPAATPASTMRLVTLVEKDYAILHLNGTSVYLGAMVDAIVPMAGLEAATPIGIANLFNSDGAYFGALTRHPVDSSVVNQELQYSHALWPILNGFATTLQPTGIGWGMYGYPDRLQANRVGASELAVLMLAGVQGNGNGNSNAKLVGAYRGKFRNIRITTFPPIATNYDQVVVDGRKAIILADRGYTSSAGGPFVGPYDSYQRIKWGFVFDTGIAA